MKKKYPEYADIPFFEYFEATLLTNQKKNNNIWRCSTIYDKLTKQLENIPADRELYKWINLSFARINLILDSPEKALKCITSLPDEIQDTGYFQMLKGVSYHRLCGTSPHYEKNEEYEAKAYEAFKKAVDMDFSIGDDILRWMKEYEKKRENN